MRRDESDPDPELVSGSCLAAASARRRLGRVLAWVGLVLQLAQLIALVAAIWLLVRSYSGLLAGFDGTQDLVAPLRQAADEFLLILVWGLGAVLAGIAMIIVAATSCRLRDRWFQRVLTGYGWYLVLSPPLTPFGLWMIWYARSRRGEFGVS